jgi:hypothetical protein
MSAAEKTVQHRGATFIGPVVIEGVVLAVLAPSTVRSPPVIHAVTAVNRDGFRVVSVF